MKRIFFVLVLTFIILPLQAATLYIDTEGSSVYIAVNPYGQYGEGVYYGGYGIHSGLGPNTGRTVNHYHLVPAISRSERFINNSGTGSHGPGTY